MTFNKLYTTIGIIIAVGIVGIFSFGQIGHQNTAQGQTGPSPVTVTNTPDSPVPVTVTNNPLPVTISGDKIPTLNTVCPAGDLQHWDKITYRLAQLGDRGSLVSSNPAYTIMYPSVTYEVVLPYDPSDPGKSLEFLVKEYIVNHGYRISVGSAVGPPPDFYNFRIINVNYAIACSTTAPPPVTTAPQ